MHGLHVSDASTELSKVFTYRSIYCPQRSAFQGIPTAQKMKFSSKNFFSKDFFSKLQIWLHLLWKSLMENFIFCAVPIILSEMTLSQYSKGILRHFVTLRVCNIIRTQTLRFYNADTASQQSCLNIASWCRQNPYFRWTGNLCFPVSCIFRVPRVLCFPYPVFSRVMCFLCLPVSCICWDQ